MSGSEMIWIGVSFCFRRKHLLEEAYVYWL